MSYNNFRNVSGDATATAKKEKQLQIGKCSRMVEFEFVQISKLDLPEAISDCRRFLNVLQTNLFPNPRKARIYYQPNDSTGLGQSVDIQPGFFLVKDMTTRIVESMTPEKFAESYEVETEKTETK